MNLSIDSIKKLLKEITPCQSRLQHKHGTLKCNYFVPESEENMELIVYDDSGPIISKENCEFIAQSPSIVKYLLERVEDLENKLAIKCEYHVDYGSPLDKKMEDLELKFKAARNYFIAELKISYRNKAYKYGSPFVSESEIENYADILINEYAESELERMKGNK